MDIVINIPSEPLICSICLSSLQENENNIEKVVKLDCSHSYHNYCITKWCYQHNTCPLCRTNIKKKDMDVISHNQNNRDTNDNAHFKYIFKMGVCCILWSYVLILGGIILLIIKLSN